MIDKPNVHVPHFPTYDNARALLRLLDGQSKRVLMQMREVIRSNVGTPQENRDWSQPEIWIPTILTGAERALAERLWIGSQGVVNPRHILGAWLLCSSYELVITDGHDTLCITSNGRDFLDYPAGEIEQQLDYAEGLLHLLAIVAEHGPGKRSDVLPHFTQFLLQYSKVQSEAAISGRWYDRITNLVERKLVFRDGIIYQISPDGLKYLERSSSLLQNGSDQQAEKSSALRRLLNEQRSEVRRQIVEALRQVNPYQLENLIKTLLEAMGYENVEVTKQSGDGGIDVIGDIRVGITYVREVVQVKHHPRSNIQRPILDQLRGSLHRFKAYRGTIITTGRFSKGVQDAAFEQGAAPITLIDGERLIDLLIEHQIGVKRRSIEVLDFSPADFRLGEDRTEVDV